jgi:hypothetical protein
MSADERKIEKAENNKGRTEGKGSKGGRSDLLCLDWQISERRGGWRENARV